MKIDIPGEKIGNSHPLYELGVTINTIEVGKIFIVLF